MIFPMGAQSLLSRQERAAISTGDGAERALDRATPEPATPQ